MGCGASAAPPERSSSSVAEDEPEAGKGRRGAEDSSSEYDDEEEDEMELPDVMVVDEEEASAESVNLDLVPDYWVNKQGDDSSIFDDMFYVAPEQHGAFNEILMSTYHPRVTQDRPCPTGEHRGVKGGCQCVRPGGDPGLPVSYHVRRVLRVEDSSMWSRYVKKREAIRASRAGDRFRTFHPPIKSDQVADRYPELFAPLDSKLNEVYLFHGTRVRYALSIAQDDFNIDLAGSSRGTMYGPGAYLAESSTKADEYAKDDGGGYYQGVFAMLICRVCMGKLYYTRKKNEEAVGKIRDGSHDSTCGDRSHPPIDTFRELVVYDADQLYPEYIVLYQRAHQKDDPAMVEYFCDQPFHMELPLHWSNCHMDPNSEDNKFDAQYLVREAAKQLLQRLVDDSLAEFEGEQWWILQARRVEVAHVWSRYVGCKFAMRERAGDNDFEPCLQDPAQPRAVLEKIVADGDGAERSITLTDLEERINEHYLWCPATKEAAEWLARGAECGQEVGLPLDDVRFHTSLGHSFSAVEANTDGTRHVLLCRVICGDFYTEGDSKDSILLKSEEGHCSVAVAREEQVYVEYILDLTSSLESLRRFNSDLDDDLDDSLGSSSTASSTSDL